jgi:hypothetical protein
MSDGQGADCISAPKLFAACHTLNRQVLVGLLALARRLKYRMRWIVNLEDVLKLPFDGELSELERIALLRQKDAQERLAEKRQQAKAKFQESMEKVVTLYRGLDFDLACAKALKLDKYADQLFESRDSQKFRCLLHTGGPWAHLYRVNTGDILYKCPHDGGYRLTLPQVRASLAYKDVKAKAVNILHDHNAEHMVWRLRLLYEAGSIETTHVPHKPLPEAYSYSQMNADGPKASIVKTYYGLLNLLALKWNVPEWSGNGTTFSLNFGAAWCGLTKDKVRGAMRWLLKNKYIREVDTLKGSFGKPLGVYVPRLR